VWEQRGSNDKFPTRVVTYCEPMSVALVVSTAVDVANSGPVCKDHPPPANGWGDPPSNVVIMYVGSGWSTSSSLLLATYPESRQRWHSSLSPLDASLLLLLLLEAADVVGPLAAGQYPQSTSSPGWAGNVNTSAEDAAVPAGEPPPPSRVLSVTTMAVCTGGWQRSSLSEARSKKAKPVPHMRK
jgi:hypothetical protein